MTDVAHSYDSSQREKLIEHLFVGDLLRCMWRQGLRQVEVLRADVDSAGYDLVLECNGIIRHVQLKSSTRAAKTHSQKVNIRLGDKPSGCVVWIRFDPETMVLGPFLWFGGRPGVALPHLGDRVGKHTKGDQWGRKGDRPNIRVVNKGKFTTVADINEVAARMFGSGADTLA